MPDEAVLALSLFAALAVLPGAFLPRRTSATTSGFTRRAVLGGALLFLTWGVLRRAFDPVGVSLEHFRDGIDDPSETATNTAVLLVTILLGFALPLWQAGTWTRGVGEFRAKPKHPARYVARRPGGHDAHGQIGPPSAG